MCETISSILSQFKPPKRHQMIQKPQIENGVEMRMFQLISLRMQSTKCISRWHQDISNVWMFMISPRNIQAVKHQWLLQCKRVFGKHFSPNGLFRYVFDYLLWLRYQHWAEAAFAPLIKTSHLLLGNHMIRIHAHAHVIINIRWVEYCFALVV